MTSKQPDFQSKDGAVRIVDSHSFPAASTIAAALVDLHPGGMRELHWHPNADEWQYWVSGQARMTVFSAGGRARTFDFHTGDVGYVPRAMGYYIENTGNDPVRYLELFRSSYYTDVSLMSWMVHTQHDLVTQHLNIDPSVLDRLSMQRTPVV
jgi:oxalate decarboxylase